MIACVLLAVVIQQASGVRELNKELIEAIVSGDLRAVESLLTKGAGSNAKGEYGETPLGVAATYGRADVIRLLVESDVDINSKDGDGHTALMIGSLQEQLKAVQTLLDLGADVNVKDNETGWTALHYGVGHTEIVRTLLATGAEVDARARNGATPLMSAIAAGNQESPFLLLQAGADPNAKLWNGHTVLMGAAWNGRCGVVRALLEAGADIGASDEKDRTALDIALERGHQDIAELLEKADQKK